MMDEPAALDEYDRKILSALRDEARLTNLDLAEKVHLSASQCSRRRTRLERSGVIRGYRADIDVAMLGAGVSAFITISLIGHSPDRRSRLHEFLIQAPTVLSCHTVTGTSDYLVRVATKDLPSLNTFVLALLDASGGPLQVNSMIVLESIKEALSRAK